MPNALLNIKNVVAMEPLHQPAKEYFLSSRLREFYGEPNKPNVTKVIHEDSNDVSLLLGERGHEFPTKITFLI